MKRTSLITDFVCYFIVFIVVFSIGATFIAKEMKYNRELLEIDNDRNIEASKYARDFSSKQKEIIALTAKKDELLNTLNDLTLLTEKKLNDSSNQDNEIKSIQAEIDLLTESITSNSKELNALSTKVKELNSNYLEKNNIYLDILKKKIND